MRQSLAKSCIRQYECCHWHVYADRHQSNLSHLVFACIYPKIILAAQKHKEITVCMHVRYAFVYSTLFVRLALIGPCLTLSRASRHIFRTIKLQLGIINLHCMSKIHG